MSIPGEHTRKAIRAHLIWWVSQAKPGDRRKAISVDDEWTEVVRKLGRSMAARGMIEMFEDGEYVRWVRL